MADVKVTLKRVIDAQGNTDNIHPTTDWDQVENKPSTFTPTAHTLNSHTDVDANPTANGQVLTWDADNSQWIASTTAGGGVSKADLQNVYIYGKADGAITIGQAVQFAGVEGDHILIKPAVPSEINAEPTLMIGIAETTLADNEFGYVIVNGRLNLDTSTYTAGDLLYFASAGSTAGALTTTEPTDPNASIQMAAVSIDGVGNGEFIIRNTILTRQINEVIGLQGALDSKIDRSGDTMSGNLLFANGANRTIRLGSATNYYYDIRSINDDFGIYETSSIPRLYIKYPNGNVGISTDSPGYNLDVYKNSADINPTFRLQNAAENAGSGINLSGNNNTANSLIWHNGAVDALMFQTDTATYDANKIAMTINSSQNVGIGTDSPERKLHILSDIEEALRLDVTTNTGGIHFRENGTFKGLFGFSNGTTMYTGADADDMVWRSEGKAHIVSNTNQNGITVSGGNVGIGTTSPGQKLHVVGDARVEGDLTVNGTMTVVDTDVNTTEQWIITNDGTGPAAIINQTGAQPVIDIQDDGTSAFYIEDGGNVGIGTTDPGDKLDVNGSVTASTRFRLTDGPDDDIGNGAHIYFDGGTNTNYHLIQSMQGRLAFHTYNNAWIEGLSLSGTNGNVGIKKTNPATMLHIEYPSYIGKDTVQGVLRITGQSNTENGGNALSAGTAIEFFNRWTGGLEYSVARIAGRGSQGYDGGLQFDVAQNTNAGQSNFVNAMTILKTGDVGIGVTEPVHKLQVNGVTRTNGLFIPGRYSFEDSAGAIQIDMASSDYNAIRFYEGTSGVGTIHAFSSTWSDDTLANSAGAFNLDAVKGITFGPWNSPAFVFDTVNTRLGIGTSSPGSKLDVAGSITEDGVLLTDKYTKKYTWAPPIVYWDNGGTDAGYRNILKVTSDTLSSGGILYVDGTTGSVVVNARFEILVNHSSDIIVKSLSTGYTQVKIKVQSGNNDEFNVLMARDRNDTNETTLNAVFIPYDQNATVTTYTDNPAVSYSSSILTHGTLAFSENITATGGGTGKLYVEGNEVWHAGNDGSGSGLDADLLDGRDSSAYMYYRGNSTSGDFQTFQSTANTVRFDQVSNTNNLSNKPPGYTYGGVISARGDNFGLQIWGSHTGDLEFKTQWNNDQYSGWRTIWHEGNFNPASYLTTSGKAADSNLLDGIDSSSFLRSDADDTMTANLTLDGYFKRGAYYRKVITLNYPGSNVGQGRWFVRLWQSSAGATFSGGKIRTGGNWSWANIMGHIEIDYGVYVAGSSTTVNSGGTRFSSGVGGAYDNMRIGDIEVVDGYVGFYVWSLNSNNPYVEFDIYCTREPLFTYVNWTANTMPAQRAVEFHKGIDVSGTTILRNRTYLHKSGTGGGQNLFTGLNADSSDGGRAQLVLASAYSDLVIASSQANNIHGSTLTFATYNPSNAAEYRKFVINQGNWGDRLGFLEFGYAAASSPNPHSNISDTRTVMTLNGVNKRVGIGTRNPGVTLDVIGDIRAQSGTFSTTNNGVALQMDGGSSAEGIRMQPDSTTTYPVFLKSRNPSGGGEASAWIFKEENPAWGMWHNNPVNSFDITRSTTSGGIASNVGGGTNTVMIRLNAANGDGSFAGNVYANVNKKVAVSGGSLTYTLLGSINLTTGTDTLNISPSNGLNSVVVIEAEVFANASPATWTGPLGEIGASSTYKSNLWSSTTRYTDYYRNSAGTQIYFSATGTNNVYRARVYELKVA